MKMRLGLLRIEFDGPAACGSGSGAAGIIVRLARKDGRQAQLRLGITWIQPKSGSIRLARVGPLTPALPDEAKQVMRLGELRVECNGTEKRGRGVGEVAFTGEFDPTIQMTGGGAAWLGTRCIAEEHGDKNQPAAMPATPRSHAFSLGSLYIAHRNVFKP